MTAYDIFRRPIVSTTPSPLSEKESTALYVSLMGSTKAPQRALSDDHVDDDAEHSDETTTKAAHLSDEEAESDEEHYTHTASSEDLEGHTEEVLITEDEDIPVEQKLRQLTDNIQNLDKISSNDDETRQSFLSLSDLIKTLRPDEQKPLQIDSAYSRSQVLGEKPDVVYHPRNTGDVANRSLFK